MEYSSSCQIMQQWMWRKLMAYLCNARCNGMATTTPYDNVARVCMRMRNT